jgi:hypothetical protein
MIQAVAAEAVAGLRRVERVGREEAAGAEGRLIVKRGVFGTDVPPVSRARQSVRWSTVVACRVPGVAQTEPGGKRRGAVVTAFIRKLL